MKRIAFITAILCSCGLLFGCNSEESSRFSKLSDYKGTESESIEMKIDEKTLSPDGFTLNIVNNTSEEGGYGMDYLIEQKRDGKWYSSEDEQSFTALGVKLDPNGENDFDVKLDKPLEKGKYRIIKSFNVSSEEIECAEEFTLS